MNERRRAFRRRVVMAGQLEFSEGSLDCRVRNLSDRGATLLVKSEKGLPHEMALRLLRSGEKFYCYVVWRDEKQLGVVFGPEKSIAIAAEGVA